MGEAQTTVDQRLEAATAALGETGWAAEVADADWRLHWVSDDMRILLAASGVEQIDTGLPFITTRRLRAGEGIVSEPTQLAWLERHIPYVLHDTGDPGALREQLGPEWAGLVDAAEPVEPPLSWTGEVEWAADGQGPMTIRYIAQRMLAPDGALLGTSYVYGASLRARLLAYVARGSGKMFERMVRLAQPARREAAIMFADLQASGALSRRLPSAAYFALLREFNRAIDDVVIDGAGIVGKHAGDGMTAFFLAEDAGSVSAAARAAIDAARRATEQAREAAECLARESHGIFGPDDVKLNIGVHWGGTLYMGQVVTSGRLEVTALGDEVNECARIQETARDGDLLASKALVERLSPEDAEAVGIDPTRTAYLTLGDLPGASDKAIRDAGGLAVCRVRRPAPAAEASA